MTKDFKFVNEINSDRSLEKRLFSHDESIKTWKILYHVFMMDHINMINKFGMPLLDAVG